MSELSDSITEAVEERNEGWFNSIIAVVVALTATFMALCNVKDGNIVRSPARSCCWGSGAGWPVWARCSAWLGS